MKRNIPFWLNVIVILFTALIISIAVAGLLEVGHEQTETLSYTGKLASIEYWNLGWESSVSNTILHFSDGTTFNQGGYYQYAIGLNYTVFYTNSTWVGSSPVITVGSSPVITVLNVSLAK
jgi:hypothetical protein